MIRRSLHVSQVATKKYVIGQHRTKDLQSSFAKITKVSPRYSEKYTKMQKTKSGLWKRQRVEELHQGAMEPVWQDKTKYRKKTQWIDQQQTKIAPDILRKKTIGERGIPIDGRDLIQTPNKQFNFKEEFLVTNFIMSYYNSNPIQGVKILKLVKRNNRIIDVDFTIFDGDFSVTNTNRSDENRKADLARKQLNASAKNLKPQLEDLIEETYATGDLWKQERDGSWLISDYSKLQLNFKYVSQRQFLMDETKLVEDEELAAEALKNIVQIKTEELEQKRLIRQDYYLKNPDKLRPTDEFYSQTLSKEKMTKRDVPEMTLINQMKRSNKEDGLSYVKKDSASYFTFGKSKNIETE